ncbi:MAG: ABC transporter permease [Streptosporangiales bacterium]|nr:ABC transporter permease [Streptosporangiales bacterium]
MDRPAETDPRPVAARADLEGEPEAGAGETLLSRTLRANSLWIFLVLVVLVLGFSVARPQAFLSPFNIQSIFTNAATLLVVSVGMTYVIVSAGIDLSVGSVLVFSGVVAAKTMTGIGGQDSGWGPIVIGLVVGLLGGLAWGITNGILVAKAHIPPLIVTLGTLGMALGSAQIITGGTDVRNVPVQLTAVLGQGRLLGVIPWLVVIAVVVTIVGGLVLATTRFGRYTYAIGSNTEAARRAGIAVDRHLLKVYALSGLLAGLAGDLSLAYFTTTTIGGHTTDNLSAIAAVVLGGTSLFGGVGTMFGTVVGVFIPAVLGSGFVIIGVQPFWQSVAVGAVLVAAVFVDQWRRRARENR